jgi:molecular chaperone GrpE
MEESQVIMTDKEKQPDSEQSIDNQAHSENSESVESVNLEVEATVEPFSPDDRVEADVAESSEDAAVDSTVNVAAETETPSTATHDSQAPLSELSQAVNTLKTQLEERTSQYLRIAADFENFRKRTQKEKEDLEVQVKCSTISELLPVVDNFERARLQIKPQTDAEMSIHKSYQSVYKQLVDCLKRVGVSPMRSEGKAFDPSLHEAVIREATDQYEEGIVIEELVRGYLLGERVLRHALVKVSAPSEDASNEEVEVS